MQTQINIAEIKTAFVFPSYLENAVSISLGFYKTIEKISDAVVFLNQAQKVYIRHEKNEYKLARFFKRHADINLDSVYSHRLNEQIKTAFYKREPLARYRLQFRADIENVYVNEFADGCDEFPLGSCMTDCADAYSSVRHPVSIYETEKHKRVFLAVLYDIDPENGSRALDYMNENELDRVPVARALVNSDAGAVSRVYYERPDDRRALLAMLDRAGFDDYETDEALCGLEFKHVTNHGRLVFPYLDGVNRVYINHNGRVEISDYEGNINCESTSGLQDEATMCDCCGDAADPDYITTVNDGSQVCDYCLENNYAWVERDSEYYEQSEVVYSEHNDESIHESDATYCDCISDYVHNDDVSEITIRLDGRNEYSTYIPDDISLGDALEIISRDI